MAERSELEDRRLLGELKEAAIRAIERHAHQKKLLACLADVATAGITRKSTELTNNMATQILADALNEELGILDIANLRVAMKPEGERGRSTFKLVLERPGTGLSQQSCCRASDVDRPRARLTPENCAIAPYLS